MLAVVLTASVIYYVLAKCGLSLPCVFYEVTGLYCPGCGATRMCHRFMSLDFYGAFRSNQVSFFVMPFLGAVIVRKVFCYVKYGQTPNEKWMTVGAVIAVAALLIFGVLRNLPWFDCLKPI